MDAQRDGESAKRGQRVLTRDSSVNRGCLGYKKRLKLKRGRMHVSERGGYVYVLKMSERCR